MRFGLTLLFLTGCPYSWPESGGKPNYCDLTDRYRCGDYAQRGYTFKDAEYAEAVGTDASGAEVRQEVPVSEDESECSVEARCPANADGVVWDHVEICFTTSVDMRTAADTAFTSEDTGSACEE